MESLEEIAKRYLVYEKSDISDFQRKARILQSLWREEKGYEVGEYRGKKRGNFLPMPWAKETLSNYLSDTIRQVVQDEVINNPDDDKLYGEPRIFNNLLSSQPLCFNLFAELKVDLHLASEIFRALLPERIKEIIKIEFEFSPGRRNERYIGDRSAFDVYAEFVGNKGEKGFVGIEVKYHENLKDKPSQLKERYLEVAREMNCFKDDCFKILQESPLEQIWRDHLLAGSILQADGFDDGFFVFLYPKGNIHCSRAIKDYRNCLTNSKTFEYWVIEDVAKAIKENTSMQWIDELIDRYLNFQKLRERPF